MALSFHSTNNKTSLEILDLCYFMLFQIEKKYMIDLEQLNHSYYALQKKYHPDIFFSNNTSIDTLNTISSHINAAYKCLSCPLQRAVYLYNSLKLEPLDINSTSDLSQEFLIEQMDVYEQLKNTEDKTYAKNKMNDLIIQVSEHFDQINNFSHQAILGMPINDQQLKTIQLKQYAKNLKNYIKQLAFYVSLKKKFRF